MKRHGFLFEKAFTRENLYEAYLDAKKGKLKKAACFNFGKRLARNLDRLYTNIHSGKYRPSPYFDFPIVEHKVRRIYAPTFHDLVVQHAIYRIIEPIYVPTFIDQSYACQKGKGTHKAADYAQQALRNAPAGSYTIKLDIRKFFYRILRPVLKALLLRKIKDHRFVDFMMLFTDYGEPVGIPIGNLLSQIFALIVLNPLDHFIKRVLKIKMYCRYVDDFVLFGISRKQCIECRDKIIDFIRDKLGLELSKYTIAPVRKGLNFVGYRTWASRRFIRKHSLFKFRRALKKGKLQSAISILGHARRTHSFIHLLKTAYDRNRELFEQLPAHFRRRYQPARAGHDPRTVFA